MKLVSQCLVLVAVNVIGSSLIFMFISGISTTEVLRVAQSYISGESTSHKRIKEALFERALKQQSAQEASFTK
jgi:hypothetical protein